MLSRLFKRTDTSTKTANLPDKTATSKTIELGESQPKSPSVGDTSRDGPEASTHLPVDPHPQQIRAGSHDQAPTRQNKLGCHVLYDPSTELAAVVDVVFVHGLTGTSFNTWCRPEDGDVPAVHWPHDLLSKDIPDARIISFGYDADVAGIWNPASTNCAANHAENLLGGVTRLRERTETEERPIIFVMHSLGGLIVQNSLDLSRSSPEPHLRAMERMTMGLCFMGTPHLGADKARWGAAFAAFLSVTKITNRSIVKVLKPDSEVLALIQKQFHAALRARQSSSTPISVTCFYEELPITGIGVIVDKKSATLPGYPSYGLHADHRNMVRFMNSDDSGYNDVLGELMRWVKAARRLQDEETDLQQECLRSLYFDGLKGWEEEISTPLKGTASWVWDTKKCQVESWLVGERGGLFRIHGKAASGKSTLVKYIVQSARDRWPAATIASYHIRARSKDPVGTTTEGIIRAILWDILRHRPGSFSFVLQHFKDMKDSTSETRLNCSTLQSVLTAILSHADAIPLWIFIDGLDECSDDLLDVIDTCNTWVAACARCARICVSSRPERELSPYLDQDSSSTGNILVMEEHTAHDITICVWHELRRVRSFANAQLMESAIDSITAQANGLFMWAKLASRETGRKCMSGDISRPEQLPRLLEVLPKECHMLYDKILQKRVAASEFNTTLYMLALVAVGRRPYTLHEYHHLLGKEEYSSFDADATMRTIDWFTGGLLEVRAQRVVFSHNTISTFVAGLRETQHVIFEEAHYWLARACISALRVASFEMLTEDPGSPLFEEYAIQYSLQHFHAADEHLDDSILLSWQRAHIARRWNHDTSSIPHLDDHTSIVIAQVILSAQPVFQLDCGSSDGSMGDNQPRRDLHTDDQLSLDLELLLTVQTAAGYDVSFFVDDVLRAGTESIPCTVIERDLSSWCRSEQSIPIDKFALDVRTAKEALAPWKLDNSGSFETTKAYAPMTITQQFFLFDNFGLLPPYTEMVLTKKHSLTRAAKIDQKAFSNPVSAVYCARQEFEQIKLPQAQMKFDRCLLGQLQMVLTRYAKFCQPTKLVAALGTPLETAALRYRIATFSAKSNVKWATPMHQAAYHGLNEVMNELYRWGAHPWCVSDESQYGTPLMAAIWGVYDMTSLHNGSAAVAWLLRRKHVSKTLGKAHNSGRLGRIPPLLATVKLYIIDRRRSGQSSDRLRAIMEQLIQRGAPLDVSTRAIMRSHADLKSLLDSCASQPSTDLLAVSLARSLPISITSAQSFGSRASKQNASIGYWVPSATVHSGAYRMAQTGEWTKRIDRQWG